MNLHHLHPEIEQVGTIEILRERSYALDPEAMSPALDALVSPGEYPLYRWGGVTYFWLMDGTLNAGRVQRRGGGMISAIAADIDSGVPVRFPSRRMGDDEFRELQAHPVATEGHAEQRIRIKLTERQSVCPKCGAERGGRNDDDAGCNRHSPMEPWAA